MNQSEQQKENLKNKDSLRGTKHKHSHYKDPRRKRKKGTETVFIEIMAENFPNLAKETGIQVQEAQKVPNKMNSKRPIPRYIVIKMANFKDKESILKAARVKQLVIKENQKANS